MKKSILRNLTLIALFVGAVSLVGCAKKKGCTEAKDDKYDATAEEDDGTCDETATTAKFVGSWTGSPGNYPFTVSRTADYTLTITTNFGLTDVGGSQLVPANITSVGVSKNQATKAPSSTFYNGTVSNITVSYNSSTSATVAYTLAGFGTGVDGSYTESLTK